MKAFSAQLLQALQRVAGEQQLQHLVEEPRRRHVLEQRPHLADRLARRGVDGEAELGRQAHRAQHAHRVLAVARARVADHAQRLLLDVGDAVVVVDDGLGAGVVVQRVDGEVAPGGVFLLVAEDVVAQHAAVLVGVGALGVLAGAEGGDLDRLRSAHHVHDLEAPADDARAPERGAHLFGRGAGGDVVVLGRLADQQVAHRAADHEGLEALLLQHRAHLARGRRELLAADAVAFDGNEGGFVACSGRRALEDLAQQLADHRERSRACIGAQ